MIREKLTKSGGLLEADFFPIWDDGRRMPDRAPKTKPSTEAKKKYNLIQTIKRFIRLINANFGKTDYFMHVTYKPENAPQTEKEARRDMANYIRRVKTKRQSELKKQKEKLAAVKAASELMPDNVLFKESIKRIKKKIKKLKAPFKNFCVLEKVTYKSGKLAGKNNWHFHLFLTGGLEDSVMEDMWTGGIRCNCDNYQPDKFGPEAAALYISKDPQGSRRYSYSRNLSKPEVKHKDGYVTRRAVEQMAKLRTDDKEYWEKRYKGYKFIRCYNRYNEYNGNWYVSVVMYKTDTEITPRWEFSEWIE